MITALIDGDGLAWLAAYSRDPASTVTRSIERSAAAVNAGRIIVCLSDASRRYWRHDLFAGYKPNRSDPPAGLDQAKAALRKNWLCRELAGLEADDVMGILATHADVAGERVMIANDKDLRTVPGRHFNPAHPDRGLETISRRQADWNHLAQAICGDATDGYSGVRGIGPKKVGRILWGDDPRLWWAQVILAFKSVGLREEDALLQAQLARICRADDFDSKTRRVIPWQPARAGSQVEPALSATDQNWRQ